MEDIDVDKRLLEDIQHGKQEALASLYDRHAAHLLGVARFIIKNHREAEDLIHDVFIEAWQKASNYDAKRGSVRNWLLLRVRSRAIDRLRKLVKTENHAEIESIDMRSVIPDDSAQQADFERARRATANLSQVQQQVLEASYFEGLSCREIAAKYNIPEGTVKSRLSAAVSALRIALDSNTGEDK